MDWFDKFKRFLGVPPRQEIPPYNDQDRPSVPSPYSRDDEFPSPFQGTPNQSFSIFTNPLEIHKYFEQQMSEMLRSFGFQEFPQIEIFTEGFDGPVIEEIPDDENESGDLREQFLKPGYEKAVTGESQEKRDVDIDGKLDMRDWGSVFRGERAMTPYERPERLKTQFFGQSVTTKTIRNPDGSFETHHTVRDSQGNEETTIRRKVDDKEYTITKRRDKDGKEETIENLVNLDEKEVDKFFPKQDMPQLHQQPWPFFDRFFK